MNTLFKTLPKLSLALADTKLGALLNLLKFWYFFVTRKFGLAAGPMSFNFVHERQPFTLVLIKPMDIAVLREIYLDKEYEWCPVEQPQVIIDLGAHFGDTTLYYHTRFPQARIIAVEPTPESYARLVENTKHIPTITPVQAAITDADGEITLNVMPSSLGNSLVSRSAATTSVVVPAMTLQTLLDTYQLKNVDLLKFDIEGAEFAIFKDTQVLTTCKALIGEVHLDLSTNQTLESFLSHFSGFSTETFEISRGKRYLVHLTKQI